MFDQGHLQKLLKWRGRSTRPSMHGPLQLISRGAKSQPTMDLILIAYTTNRSSILWSWKTPLKGLHIYGPPPNRTTGSLEPHSASPHVETLESLQNGEPETPTLMSSPPMAYPVDKEYYFPTPVLINVLSRICILVVEYSADYPASGV